MKPPVLLGIGSAIALALMLALVVNVRSQTADGLGDFAAFYAGARSLATGDLYDIERLHQIELEHTGKYSSGHGYVRPPFHAVLIWPLSRLPYRSAYTLWNLILAASIAGFIALWRPPPRFLADIAVHLPVLPSLRGVHLWTRCSSAAALGGGLHEVTSQTEAFRCWSGVQFVRYQVSALRAYARVARCST